MTSFRQIEANRRNALKSTGPRTEDSKQRSRCNALRHGLTAETVIGAMEDAEDYKAFEAAIAADYDAQSAVERELVLRLASLLWRLRRATTMETGLFEIQAGQLLEVRQCRQLGSDQGKIVHTLFLQPEAGKTTEPNRRPPALETESPAADPASDLAQCFLRIANLPTSPLDRLSRYEATLWRQAGRILFALDSIDRRKPQERRGRNIGPHQEFPNLDWNNR
jgi:hypothetical protein